MTNGEHERLEDVATLAGIPEYMRDGLITYILDHHSVGHFLTAVLSNDLREAVSRADDENVHALAAYVRFLYNHAPAPCWGSKAKVEAWLKQ